jgi:hypothetical protein
MADVEFLHKALEQPGMLLDIGCHTGNSLFQAVEAAESRAQGRACWGFDAFGRMVVCEKDGEGAKRRPDMYVHPQDVPRMVCEERVVQWHAQGHGTQVRLAIGEVSQVFPRWLEEHLDPMCWVHFGTGCYVPTVAVLSALPERMPVGGVICSANWGNGWHGETVAIEEFLSGHANFVMETEGYVVRAS